MWRYLLPLVLVLVSCSASAQGASLEGAIGTGPSVELSAVWDVTSHLTCSVALLAALHGISTQTNSVTVQTPSLSVGVRVAYQSGSGAAPFRGFVGAGMHAELLGSTTRPVAEASLGARLRLTPQLYAFCDSSILFPLTDTAAWNWRVSLGIGIHLRF
jgi:hypothetical protein